jgi:hypothetical protein
MSFELDLEGPHGMRGPEYEGELHKMSAHIKEWRGRYYVLYNRKLYYYNNKETAPSSPMQAGEEGEHKAWLDMTGATIELFEDDDSQGHWYGLKIQEEFSIRGAEKTKEEGQCHRVCTSLEADKLRWKEALMLSSRPAWVTKEDARSMVCMESGEKFSLMNRKQHCRACGGVFLKVNTTQMELPATGYEMPVTVCRPCSDGSKPRSRWVFKTQVETRSNHVRSAHEAATDAVVGGAMRGMKGMKNKMKKGVADMSKKAASATGVQALAIEVRLELNHTGYMTKLGAVRKNWKVSLSTHATL